MNQEHKGLGAIKVVVAVLEVRFETRVLNLSIFQGQKEELSDPAGYLAEQEEIYHPLWDQASSSKLSFNEDDDNKWNDKSEGVNAQQVFNGRLRSFELPVDDLLNCLLVEELFVVRVVTEQVRQEQVIDVVKLLRQHVDAVKVLGVA